MDDGGDYGLSTSIEYGHLGMSGLSAAYDSADPESRQATIELTKELDRVGLEKYKSLPSAMGETHHMIGPLKSNYHLWLQKIKKAFDPNVVSDPGSYIEP